MMVLPECIYWDRDIVICFKEVLKDVNETCVLTLYVKDAGVSKSLENLWINTNMFHLIMEQIKLQCLCSVVPKDVSGTSKIKTKLGTFSS